MQSKSPQSVQITTDNAGNFLSVIVNNSALTELVKRGGESWSAPILLYGPDSEEYLSALMDQTRQFQNWAKIEDFGDVSRGVPAARHLKSRFSRRYYDRYTHAARTKLHDILRGRRPLNELISYILEGSSAEAGSGPDQYVEGNFLNAVERLCNTTALIVPWQTKVDLLPPFVLAVWLRRSRLRPIILTSDKAFTIAGLEGHIVSTSTITFSALAEELQRVYGLSVEDVEKAYRVWQLSRSGTESKAQATTPKTVGMSNARNFVEILARARTEPDAALATTQKSAPVIFALEDGPVDIKRDLSTKDSNAIVSASAASLQRRIERLKHDIHIGNLVPSSPEIFLLLTGILDSVKSGSYTDGDIVEVGLEINALQWHVDAVRAHLSEVSLGELVGCFATANLFLNRFPVWLDFTGAKAPEGSPDDGVAAFKVARDLLVGARSGAGFLTSEANARINEVLERAPESAPPIIREGVVRSGENLAAVTADGLSRVAVHEAKDFGEKIKDKGYEEASKAIVQFAAQHSHLLLRLGELRQWPWMTWLHSLLGK